MKNLIALLLIFTTANAATVKKLETGELKFTQIATPANPASGNNKIYAKSDGLLYTLNSAGTETVVGSGSGSGVVNYLSSNPDFESVTTGYSAYANTAGTSPVTGTGGAPVVTITRSTSSPLHGVGSGVITKDAVNRQGNGVSYAFTIDSADQAKVMQISFDYIVGSGTFVAGSDSTDSDITVWIYDVTNGTVIQPSTYRLYSNSSTTATKFISNFQTASNSTSYRIIWHVGTTSAAAYTLKYDNISVAPTSYVYGTPITDWQSYTPSLGAGYGTTSNVGFKYRRVGDFLHVGGIFTIGTVSAASGSIGLPSGLSIDTTKLQASIGGSLPVVGRYDENSASTNQAGPLLADTTTPTLVLLGRIYYVANLLNSSNANTSLTGAGNIAINFQVPIQGWSSSVQTSDQTDTRVVAATVKSSSTLTTAAATAVKPTTIVFDSHGAYDSATGKYTVPVSGVYKISLANIENNAGVLNGIYIYKNAASLHKIGDSTAANGLVEGASYTDKFIAGDAITIVQEGTAGMFGNSADRGAVFMFERLSSSSIISATETVAASFYVSTNFAASTTTPINFDTKEFDTHSAVTTSASAWKFTAPISGYYQISGYTQYTGNFSSIVYKNGTAYKNYSVWNTGAGDSILIKLIAGDFIDIRPSGVTTALGGALSAVGTCNINIIRVGN